MDTQATIGTVVQKIVAAVLQNIPHDTRGPSGPTGQTNDAGGFQRGRWNSGDIGFFDPNYEGKSSATGQAVKHSGKDTYYRDVHVFIEKVKEMTIVLGPEQVRRNLATCLRGTALIWHTVSYPEKLPQLTYCSQ